MRMKWDCARDSNKIRLPSTAEVAVSCATTFASVVLGAAVSPVVLADGSPPASPVCEDAAASPVPDGVWASPTLLWPSVGCSSSAMFSCSNAVN